MLQSNSTQDKIIHLGVIIHCSDTPNGKDIGGVKTIDEWHKARGWKSCGYHYVINPNGTVEEGRPLGTKGAHCEGHNDKIGICLVGRDMFTEEQFGSLSILLDSPPFDEIPFHEVYTHNQFNRDKDCPNMFIQRLLCYLITKDPESILNYTLLKDIP